MINNSIQEGRKNNAVSTQRYLPFGEIRDDFLILKNGGIRAIIRTSSINFNLKSENEQKSLISAYQGFLNTLSFPLQIVIRSKKLDIDDYIKTMEQKIEKQKNPLMQEQIRQYAHYIKKLIEYANIMEKQFYVIIPVDGIEEEGNKGLFDFIKEVFNSGNDSIIDIKNRLENFEKLKNQLKPRVNSTIAGLNSMGLEANQLTTVEIIDLLYQIYNPEVSKNEKIENLNKEGILKI